jgi:CBS domain-containing protein
MIEQLAALTVEQAGVFNRVAVLHDAPLAEAVELMLRWEIGALPVVANARPVGIITYSDMLKEFLTRSKREISAVLTSCQSRQVDAQVALKGLRSPTIF